MQTPEHRQGQQTRLENQVDKMWFLEEFDRQTGLITRDVALPGLTTQVVKQILAIDDRGWEIPVEAGPNDVPVDMVAAFSEYFNSRFVVDSNCEYEIGLRAD